MKKDNKSPIKLASRSRRFLASLIDFIVLYLILIVLMLPFIILENLEIKIFDDSFFALLFFILLISYYTYFEKNNYLLGKKLLKIKTISFDKETEKIENMSYKQSFVKGIFMIFSLFYLTLPGLIYLFIVTVIDKKTLFRDDLTDTRVIFNTNFSRKNK